MKSLIRTAAIVTVIATGLAFTSATFAKDKAAPAEKAAKAKNQQFTGVIDALDVAANSFTVKKGEESKTFTVNGDTKISIADKKEAALADLKAGDKVMVGFVEADGKLVAKKIAGSAAPVKKEKKEKKEKK